MDLPIPKHFRCPISLDLMKDPVALSTGITYDRGSIETWLDNGNRTCPVTNQTLTTLDLTPNHTIRRMIQDWCVAHESPHGVDRIPTPRAPVTPARVAEMLADIEMASAQRSRARFLELVAGIKNLARESERNRVCISSNGAGRALAASFRDFSGCDEAVCSEIVSALITCVFPLEDDVDVCRHIESPEALRSVVSILRSGGLEGRLNAALLVRELVVERGRAAALADTEGLVEAIAGLVREPVSPRTTKASLVAAYHLASASEGARARLASSGLVPVLLEVLVDSAADKSTCEKALGVLERVLGDEKAREEACGHALAVPVLVKKMFRVSDTATGFAVSGLWRLCRGCGGGGEEEEERRMGLARAALSVGAFEKLLLLLQVGCGGGTKEKASELLRMLNGLRGTNGEYCIDSADFRGINSNF